MEHTPLTKRAAALRVAGRAGEALEASRGALAAGEPRGEALVELGNALHELGRLEEALGAYEDAAACSPGNARALFNLGVVLERLGRGDEALRRYASALDHDPAMSRAWVNSGNVLKDRGDLGGAERMYAKALALDAADRHALNNLATIAQERGDLGEAERLYRRAAAADRSAADAPYNLALIALRNGDFARGWEDYELRFRTDPPVARLRPPRRPPVSSLDAVRTLAVRMEQGVGDQLLFSTLLPELQERVAHVVVETDPRLRAAFARNLPGIEFVEAQAAAAALEKCDAEIALGSLPRLLRRDIGDFAKQPRALLRADPGRLAAVSAGLGTGPKAAIAWRSFQAAGRRHIEDRKSAALEHFGALATRARLVDVQYGDVAAERESFDRAHPGVRVDPQGVDRFNDLEGILAMMEACDLVITTSNVTAHLAGAIGKRAWLLFPAANPPLYYWAAARDRRSLWYPGIEIVTDASWADWPAVFGGVKARLAREGLA